MNWTNLLANGGKILTGALTAVATVGAAAPSSNLAVIVPPTYQPYVIIFGAISTAILQATTAHQNAK